MADLDGRTLWELIERRAAASPDVLMSKDEDGRTTASTKAGYVRKTLVVAQMALSLVLLVCAGLTIKSLARLHQSSLGFNPDRVLTASVWLAVETEASIWLCTIRATISRWPPS